MGVFIVVNVWSGKAWIVNVPLYKMTIFRGLMPAQNCLHDVMIKVRFYACSLATLSRYSKFAALYLLIYVCNINFDIFVCSFYLKFAGLRSLSPQLIMLDRKGGRSRKLFLIYASQISVI